MTTGTRLKFTINLLLGKVITISLKLYQLELLILLCFAEGGDCSWRDPARVAQNKLLRGRSCCGWQRCPGTGLLLRAAPGAAQTLHFQPEPHGCCRAANTATLPTRSISEITAATAGTQTLPQSAEPPVSNDNLCLLLSVTWTRAAIISPRIQCNNATSSIHGIALHWLSKMVF